MCEQLLVLFLTFSATLVTINHFPQISTGLKVIRTYLVTQLYLDFVLMEKAGLVDSQCFSVGGQQHDEETILEIFIKLWYAR